MPKGVPVATVAIGASGAANAGLLAVAILATSRPELRAKLQAYPRRAGGGSEPADALTTTYQYGKPAPRQGSEPKTAGGRAHR